MADLKTRNDRCERIDFNITDWKSRWVQTRGQVRNIAAELSVLNDRLATAQSELQSLQISGLPGRAARLLGGLVGQAVSAADAARFATEARRIQSEINFLMGRIQSLNAARTRLQSEQTDLDRLIKDSQGSFIKYRCHELGYSHQNLNAPGF